MPGRFVQNATFSCYGTRRLRRILKFIQCTQCIVSYSWSVHTAHASRETRITRTLSIRPVDCGTDRPEQNKHNSSAREQSFPMIRSESGWQCRMSCRVCKHSGNVHSLALCPALLLRQALLQRAAAEECILRTHRANFWLLDPTPTTSSLHCFVRLDGGT